MFAAGFVFYSKLALMENGESAVIDECVNNISHTFCFEHVLYIFRLAFHSGVVRL